MPDSTATPSQMELDGVFPWGKSKGAVTIQEVSIALSISDDQVRNMLDVGYFLAVPIGADSQVREHVRIFRYSVVAWVREKILEREGKEPPFYQSPETLWWRGELRKLKSSTQTKTKHPTQT